MFHVWLVENRPTVITVELQILLELLTVVLDENPIFVQYFLLSQCLAYAGILCWEKMWEKLQVYCLWTWIL